MTWEPGAAKFVHATPAQALSRPSFKSWRGKKALTGVGHAKINAYQQIWHRGANRHDQHGLVAFPGIVYTSLVKFSN